MEIIRGFKNLTHPLTRSVLTIGNFDGVHSGHRKIISLAKEKAQAQRGQCVVYTFRPHPQIALRPEAGTQLLSTYEEKLTLLEELGVDVVIEEPFTPEFFTLNPQEFFKEVLLKRLGATTIVVGYDFSFGRERQGHLDQLQILCREAKVELEIVPPQKLNGEIVSSSRIRKALLEGQIEFANRLLGRPFSYEGVVLEGDKRGRQLGFPTANLRVSEKLILPYGVYATYATGPGIDGNSIPSVTNFGVRPTFQKGADIEQKPEPIVETHLLGTTIDLYGKKLKVQFISRLREEIKFKSIDALKIQILADIEKTKLLLKN